MNNENIVWSTDGETFNFDTLYEAIDDQEVGDTIYYGEKVEVKPQHLMTANYIIETIGDNAYDIVGEFADGFPDISPMAHLELDMFLKEWMDKYCKPTFYSVKNVKEHIVTQEDIDEYNL